MDESENGVQVYDMLSCRLSLICALSSRFAVSGARSTYIGCRIPFSHESRLELSPNNQRTHFWRHGSSGIFAPISPSTQPSSRKLTAWVAISFDKSTPLVVISITLTARRCIHDIMRPVVLLWPSQHSRLKFQKDNAELLLSILSFLLIVFVLTEPFPGQLGCQISLVAYD